MARVNIEDCWWTDPRRSALIRLVGDEELADGAATKMWRLAQEFWKRNRGVVPVQLFKTLRFSEHLLGVCLAELREDGVYVRGSSAYLDWVHEKREAGRSGGKKSAQRQRDAKGRLVKESKQNPSSDQAESKQIQPSVSSSSSFSDSSSENKTYSVGAVAEAPGLPGLPQANLPDPVKAAQALKAKTFVAAYVRAYQTRFPDGRPEDLNDGKVRGQIMAWIKEYPLERACQLVQVFFQMDTKWFATKGYDFLTFRNNLNKIGQALDSGRDPDGNSIDWSQVNLEG